MSVFPKTVCDAAGRSGKNSSDTSTYSADYGKCVKTNDSEYQFYVKISDGDTELTAVNIVIPMGGPESGLFRFPRVGEKVLVCQAENDGYYLMGFVPTADASFYPQNAAQNTGVVDGYNPSQRNPSSMADSSTGSDTLKTAFLGDKGMALRYRREDNADQVTKGAGNFSEIGFYNKKSKWPDVIKDYDRLVEQKKEDLKDKSADEIETILRLPEYQFSRTDVLNIQSAGDIETRADNYHLLKAKRIEFLAGTKEIAPEARADNGRDSYSVWKRDKAPLGDNSLDDVAIHGGDVHFRANRRIIFKALDEIRIQVGRTTLVIDDSGFSVVTRKVNSSVPIPNDTSFSMSPRDGISMFGENVTIASASRFSLSDAWGAGVGSTVGMLDISGRQINQKTYSKPQMLFAMAVNGITWAQNISMASIAMTQYDEYAFSIVNIWSDWVKTVAKQAKIVYDFATSFGEFQKHINTLKDRRTAAENAYDMVLHDQIVGSLPQNPSNDERYHAAQLEAVYMRLSRERALDGTTDLLDTASMLVGAEPVEMLIIALDMVLAMTAMVYTAVEVQAATEWRRDAYAATFEKKEKYWVAQKKSDFRDQLNMAALVTDNAIIDVVVGLLGTLAMGTGGPASIRLRESGDLVMKAGTQKQLYAELAKNVSVPVAVGTEKVTAVVKTVLATTKIVSGAVKLGFDAAALGQKIPVYLEKL
jgi:hypothetical protein